MVITGSKVDTLSSGQGWDVDKNWSLDQQLRDVELEVGRLHGSFRLGRACG